MQKSETITKLAKALTLAQAEFAAVPKTSDNPFFKSKYADLASVVKAAQPILAKHSLAVSQMNKANGTDSIIIETVLMHESGEWISGETELPLAKKDAQGVGSAITYGRRYGYSAILGLVTDEDDDGNAATPQKAINAPANNGQGLQIKAQALATEMVKRGAITKEDVVKQILPKGKAKFDQLTDQEAEDALKDLNAINEGSAQ